MFVRIKTIKGKPYAYLVENEWTPWGSRQRVTQYLGRAHTLEKSARDRTPLPNNFQHAILHAIHHELLNHGFIQKGTILTKGNITVNLEKQTIQERKKNVVLAMNEGYLCEHTLKTLLAFQPEERQDICAKKLATQTLEAGLKLSEEEFVHLFTLINQTVT